MHLNGDLSDFALADILQILSLGRKTGTLLVENGSVKGRIVIEQGRITGAETQPGGSLAESLVHQGLIDSEALTQFRKLGADCREWDLKSLLIESGLMTEGDIDQAAIAHVRGLVARLVDVGKGSFRLLLNETALIHTWENLKVGDGGLDIGEVLLQSATESDEAHRDGEPPPRFTAADDAERKAVIAAGISHLVKAGGNFKEPEYPPGRTPANGGSKPPLPNHPVLSHAAVGHPAMMGHSVLSQPALSQSAFNHSGADGAGLSLRIERFYALLAELSANSAVVEISLLVMRYTSEFASRGLLFGVHDSELHGIGQFGVDRFLHGKNVDALVRSISIPLDSDSLVGYVARERGPFVGKLLRRHWNMEMLNIIGGGHEGLEALAVPLLRDGKVVYVIYADNFGTTEPLVAMDELVALTSVATLALDKTLLQQMVVGAEA